MASVFTTDRRQNGADILVTRRPRPTGVRSPGVPVVCCVRTQSGQAGLRTQNSVRSGPQLQGPQRTRRTDRFCQFSVLCTQSGTQHTTVHSAPLYNSLHTTLHTTHQRDTQHNTQFMCYVVRTELRTHYMLHNILTTTEFHQMMLNYYQ